MNKIFLLLAIVFLICIVIFYNRNSKLVNIIIQKDLEINKLSDRIEILEIQLTSSNINFITEEEKEGKLKKLLIDYLEEKGENGINPEEIEQNIQEFTQTKKIIPDLIPLKGSFKISQKFSDTHQGIDWAAPLGTGVISSAYGEVLSTSSHKYFGKMIKIDHFNGYHTHYAHLSKILVSEGQLIKKGETIGLVGDTGNSTSSHLHFEILLDMKNIDPLGILDI